MSTQPDGPWPERPLGDLVAPFPERHTPLDFHRLVEFRTNRLLEGQPDLTRQNFVVYYSQYRELVRKTIESGQTDPEKDLADIEFTKAQMLEFGEAAVAGLFVLAKH